MTIAVLAPAKINLGLEVIRKRDDGFHDIATVFQTISVFDRLRITEADEDAVEIVNRIEQIEANLIGRALELARDRGLIGRHWRIEVEKRIPIAAGLGGASSDAAGILLALCRNHESAEISKVALELGSDVPFLLRGGAALGRGRGDVLEHLPTLRGCWLVLATPRIELDQKTARLYGALSPADFSDGSRVSRVATALQQFRQPDPADLVNAFERPLSALMPAVGQIHEAMLQSGAPFVALSGAGPTQYTIVTELRAAVRIATMLRRDAPVPMRVLIARPAGSCPLVRNEKTIDSTETL
jgi:4-diphosphocytidyl-2-C-methyl-D-erythritol kinase